MLSPFNRSLALGAFAVAALAASANAQILTDDFETYALGPLEGNVNAYGPIWHGWGGANTNISLVSNLQASSGVQSVLLPFGTDTVIEFDSITGGNPMVSGKWMMTADVLIPTGFDGTTYYIGMNEYTDPGPYEWAIQVGLDAVFGSSRVICDCGTAGSVITPIPFDTWTQLRWDIDLDGDWVDFYVGGVLASGYEWSKGVFGGDAYATLKVDTVDLYPGTASTTGVDVFVDNMVVSSIAGPVEPGFQYCPGDGVSPHTPCPCGNNNNGAMGGCDWTNMTTFLEGGVLTASGDATVANADVMLTATGIENNFGIFFGANNATNGGNGSIFGDGLRCAGGGLVRLTTPTMAAGNTATHGPIELSDTGAMPGVTRRYQYWFRTPGGPCGTVFNLTNGYEIAWL